MEPLHDDYVASQVNLQAAQEAQQHTLISLLKPSIFVEGNQWCVLYGDDRTGVAGFGDSPHAAVLDFNSAWYKKLGK